ncbi:MAG: type II secretion system protein GspJ [Phycisphaerales bacterium]
MSTIRRWRGGRAFTLVELIAASVIMSVIAGGTVVALSRSIRTRDAARERFEAFSRASAAVEAIARDLQNTSRDADPVHAKVAVAPGSAGAGGRRDQLLLRVESSRPVRPQSLQPEAPTAEVQYRVQEQDGVEGAGVLWRRIDPVPDSYPDAGGVAMPLVPGIVSMTVEASGGGEWYPQWDSDTDGYPHLVRVTVVAMSDNGNRTATARRTIAIDRTPLPDSLAMPTSESTEDEGTTPAGGAGGAGNTGAGATGTGTTGGGGGGGINVTRPGRGGGGQPPGDSGGRPPGGGGGGGGGGARPGGGGGAPPGGGGGGGA